MKREEFRANAAGYLDAAETLVTTVERVFHAGHEQKDDKGRRKIEAPDALFEQLAEAREILNRVSEWILSPHNKTLEKKNG